MTSVALMATGCLQNHDFLAEGPGGGGAGGTSSAPVPSTGGAGGVAGIRDGGSPPVEPTGPRTLTVVHGVIDSPWIAFCFAPVKAGVERPVTGAPLPASGLKYGRTAVLGPLPDIDLAADGVRPYVVAASGPSAIAGLDCAALVERAHATPLPPTGVPSDASLGDSSRSPLDATTRLDASSRPLRDASLGADFPRDAEPSPHDATVPVPLVRAAALPLVPEGQLALERSYLLVASGCVGGPGVRDPSELSICGDSYSPSTPTLAPLLVALSRTTKPSSVSLGFLDASPAFSHCDVRFTPPLHADPLTLAEDVVTGALRPRPPSIKFAADDIGAGNALASMQIYAHGSNKAAYDEPWQTTLDAGDLSGLENAAAYTLILVGPFPAFSAKRWWNGPLVTIVKN
jgi:hypothetical protein